MMCLTYAQMLLFLFDPDDVDTGCASNSEEVAVPFLVVVCFVWMLAHRLTLQLWI
jgi:hypothetical protein